MKLLNFVAGLLLTGAVMTFLLGNFLGALGNAYETDLSGLSGVNDSSYQLFNESKQLSGDIEKTQEEGKVGQGDSDTTFIQKGWAAVRQIPRSIGFGTKAINAWASEMNIPVFPEFLTALLILVVAIFGISLLFRLRAGGET